MPHEFPQVRLKGVTIIDERDGGMRNHSGIKRFVNPHQYPVGLELGLYDRKTKPILKARGFQP